MSTRKRQEPSVGRVTQRGALKGVHPGVAASVRDQLTRLGLDYRSVRVLSPTRVEIDSSLDPRYVRSRP